MLIQSADWEVGAVVARKLTVTDEPALTHFLMERSVLGSMIASAESRKIAPSLIDESDFFRLAHQMLYRCILDLGNDTETMLIAETLISRGQFEQVGGFEYIDAVEATMPMRGSIEHYCSIVKDRSVRRQMVERANRDLLLAADIEQPVLNGRYRQGDPVFQLYTDADLEALPPLEWVIKDLIPRRGLGMIYGPPGNGKTFVVLDLCCALAKGNFLFAKEFGIEGEHRVVYCAGEKFHGIPARKKAAQTQWGLTPEQATRFRVCRGVPQLFARDHVGSAGRFIEYMRAHYPDGIDLLVIDTLHLATIGANEISGTDTGAEIEAAKQIQSALGCVIILVHHSGAANQRERGHTGWKASADLMIKVEKVKESNDKLEVTIEKVSEAEDNFTICCSIVAVPDCPSRAIEWEGRGTPQPKDLKDDVLRIMKANEGVGMTKTDVFENTLLEGAKISAVYACLNRMAAQGSHKSGVERVASRPDGKAKDRPGTTTNPYLFKFNSALIERSVPTGYKDSDDADEIKPDGDYDPYADEE